MTNGFDFEHANAGQRKEIETTIMSTKPTADPSKGRRTQVEWLEKPSPHQFCPINTSQAVRTLSF